MDHYSQRAVRLPSSRSHRAASTALRKMPAHPRWRPQLKGTARWLRPWAREGSERASQSGSRMSWLVVIQCSSCISWSSGHTRKTAWGLRHVDRAAAMNQTTLEDGRHLDFLLAGYSAGGNLKSNLDEPWIRWSWQRYFRRGRISKW